MSDAPVAAPGFDRVFAGIFDRQFRRLFRYLDRLSGDPDLAADLAQEAFVKLYRRGAVPDSPDAWLVTVATNLFRNAATTAARRKRLLTPARGRASHGDAGPTPAAEAASAETRRRVRDALDRIPERDRAMLLMRAEGYRYRDIAAALDVAESGVGTLLARARSTFRTAYQDPSHAS